MCLRDEGLKDPDKNSPLLWNRHGRNFSHLSGRKRRHIWRYSCRLMGEQGLFEHLHRLQNTSCIYSSPNKCPGLARELVCIVLDAVSDKTDLTAEPVKGRALFLTTLDCLTTVRCGAKLISVWPVSLAPSYTCCFVLPLNGCHRIRRPLSCVLSLSAYSVSSWLQFALQPVFLNLTILFYFWWHRYSTWRCK